MQPLRNCNVADNHFNKRYDPPFAAELAVSGYHYIKAARSQGAALLRVSYCMQTGIDEDEGNLLKPAIYSLPSTMSIEKFANEFLMGIKQVFSGIYQLTGLLMRNNSILCYFKKICPLP